MTYVNTHCDCFLLLTTFSSDKINVYLVSDNITSVNMFIMINVGRIALEISPLKVLRVDLFLLLHYDLPHSV